MMNFVSHGLTGFFSERDQVGWAGPEQYAACVGEKSRAGCMGNKMNG
jgi:hypothetical protein